MLVCVCISRSILALSVTADLKYEKVSAGFMGLEVYSNLGYDVLADRIARFSLY